MLSLDLLLLGFPREGGLDAASPTTVNPSSLSVASVNTDSSSMIVAGATLFDRPNGRLLDEVLYFLLVRTNAALCRERLREHWPVTSALQGRHFRQEAYRLVEELRRTGQLSREVLLRKSMLEEGVGERLEEALGRWAEWLILREHHHLEGVSMAKAGGGAGSEAEKGKGEGEEAEERTGEAPTMTGAALACEMLLEGHSPHLHLTKCQRIVRGVLEQLRSDPHSVLPVSTHRSR